MFNLDKDTSIPTIGFNHALDFCVWMLERGGLEVAPFDRHPMREDGALREVDLGADDWRIWVHRVAVALEQRVLHQLHAHDRLAEKHTQFEVDFIQLERPAEREDGTGRWMLVPRRIGLIGGWLGDAVAVGWRLRGVRSPEPPVLWQGKPAVGERSSDMWTYYRKYEEPDRRRYWKSPTVRDYLLSPRFRVFQEEVGSNPGERLPLTLVCFVNYPGPVIYPVSPATVIVGTRNWEADAAEFEALVREAVKLLRD